VTVRDFRYDVPLLPPPRRCTPVKPRVTRFSHLLHWIREAEPSGTNERHIG
jgi:hypothetical protein